jgi:hypothetical protein
MLVPNKPSGGGMRRLPGISKRLWGIHVNEQPLSPPAQQQPLPVPGLSEAAKNILNGLAIVALLIGCGRLVGIIPSGQSADTERNTLILLAVPIAALLAQNLSSFKLTKDGIEFQIREALQKTVEEVKVMQQQLGDAKQQIDATAEQVGTAKQQLDVVQLSVAHGVGGRGAGETEGPAEAARGIRAFETKTISPIEPGFGNATTGLGRQGKPIVPNDFQKSQWGESPIANGRQLSARVDRIPGSSNLFKVALTVASQNPANPLTGNVEFHLHPSFRPSKQIVAAANGVAELELVAWGAFTVGAVADNGMTELELDLATLTDAPQEFRER